MVPLQTWEIQKEQMWRMKTRTHSFGYTKSPLLMSFQYVCHISYYSKSPRLQRHANHAVSLPCLPGRSLSLFRVSSRSAFELVWPDSLLTEAHAINLPASCVLPLCLFPLLHLLSLERRNRPRLLGTQSTGSSLVFNPPESGMVCVTHPEALSPWDQRHLCSWNWWVFSQSFLFFFFSAVRTWAWDMTSFMKSS